MMRDFCYEQTRESVDDDWDEFDLPDVAKRLGVERVSFRVYYSADNLTRRIMVFRGCTNENEIQIMTDMGFIVWDINEPAFPIPVKPEVVESESVQLQKGPVIVPALYNPLYNPEGLEKFAWGAVSPNDPNQMPMPYYTREMAQRHADNMTRMIETWEENPHGYWNKDHWKVKPEPWIVKELK